MNGFIAGTVFIWPAGGNGGIQPPAVRVCALEPRVCAPFRCGFAPHSPESLISPLRGANLLPGRGASGRVSLRLTPGKALFFRRGAQTFCREEHPAAVWVCASHPGKPYSSVEGRKLYAGKRRRRPREFAPHISESRILPLGGANLLPGRGAGGRGSLRPTPGKALFFRRGAQTFCREKPRRLCEFAPCTRESLIPPLRGANRFPGSRRGVGARNPARP